MAGIFSVEVYLCPQCLEAQASAGACPNDGSELLTCRPGDPDDPCRRPLIDEAGHVKSRAPMWWLKYSVTDLMKLIEERRQK